MGGTSSTLFSPNANMRRGDFVTVIGRLAEQLGEYIPSNLYHPFTDVSSTASYKKYVAWAYQNNIVGGTTSTTFSPNNSITRQDVAVIIQRFMNYEQLVIAPLQVITFVDESTISSYAWKRFDYVAMAKSS